jgi:hypothetical protein
MATQTSLEKALKDAQSAEAFAKLMSDYVDEIETPTIVKLS